MCVIRDSKESNLLRSKVSKFEFLVFHHEARSQNLSP